jgi:putative ABC transport system permease protein
MLLPDFRVGWRLLVKDWLWSASAVAGLAIGFLVCFVLLGFVLFSLSYDSQRPEAARTYLVKTRFHFPGVPEQWSEQTTQAVRTTIIDRKLPADVSMFSEVATSAVAENVAVVLPVTLVDADFAKMTGLHALEGDIEAALKRPDALVLTVSSAAKLFGAAAFVLDRPVTIGGDRYVVGAVVANPPDATTIPFAALAGSGSTLWAARDRRDALENWGRVFGRVYVRPHPGADLQQLSAALQSASDRSPLHAQLDPAFLAQLGEKSLMDIKLVALRDAYLDPDLSEGALVHGDRRLLLGSVALAFLILLLASINYVNLATVRTLRRQREIGILKVLGAPARAVAAQFVFESAFTTLIAAAIGLVLAWRLLPVFGDLMNRQISGLFNWQVIALFVVQGLLIGVLAGVYPAWIATRVKVGTALAGRGDQESASGLWVRRVLTVVQLASAMTLASLTLGIALQTRHAQRADPGFDARSVLVVDAGAPFTEPGPRVRSFIEAVRRLPGVAAVGQSLEAVGRQNIVQKGTMKRSGANAVTIEWKGVDPAFLGVYSIKPLAGRIFDRARDTDMAAAGWVINASTARALGFPSADAAIGQSVESENGSAQVIGVVRDIRYQSLRSASLPVAYRLTRRAPVVAIRFVDGAADMEGTIERVWRLYLPDVVPKLTRQSVLLDAHYADDVRTVKLLAAAALIAIAIAAMGVYVLSAYTVQRRTREIVLHRLFGARAADIVRLLGIETIALIGVSALIGLPPAVAVLLRYLSGFVDQTPDWGWAVVLAFSIAGLVTLASVLRGISIALRLRPTLALRN